MKRRGDWGELSHPMLLGNSKKHGSCDQIFRRKASFRGVCDGKHHMGKVVRHLFPKKNNNIFSLLKVTMRIVLNLK